MPRVPEPPKDAGELELRDYLAVLRRRKLIVVLTTIAAVLVALAYSLLQAPIYRGSAEVLLEDRPSENVINPEQRTSSADRQAQVETEIEVMRSSLVRDAVREELGYTPSVSISAKGSTSVVRISADDPDNERAAREANAYATSFIEVRREANIANLTATAEVLEDQITEIDDEIDELEGTVAALQAEIDAASSPVTRAPLEAQRDEAEAALESQRVALGTQRADYRLQLGEVRLAVNTTRIGGGQLVTEAEPAGSAVSPDPVRNGSLALMLGLLLGAGFAFLRDYLDDTVRTKDDLDALTGGLDVLALVPRVETWRNRDQPQLVSVSAPSSPPAEAYRSLRTSLQFIGIDREMRLIQFTSAAAAEGKTTTIANLGVALARAGKRVIIVDCDLRRPRVHQFFGLDNTVGFTSVILEVDVLQDAIRAVPAQPGLALLASGPPPPNPSELLSTETASALLASLGDYADYVLIDTPPLLPVSDAVIVAGHVDATVLVTTVDSTTKRSLARSIELLRQVDAPLVGAVLNGLGAEGAYGYGGYAEAKSSASAGRFSRKRTPRRAAPEDAVNAPMPQAQPVPDRNVR